MPARATRDRFWGPYPGPKTELVSGCRHDAFRLVRESNHRVAMARQVEADPHGVAHSADWNCPRCLRFCRNATVRFGAFLSPGVTRTADRPKVPSLRPTVRHRCAAQVLAHPCAGHLRGAEGRYVHERSHLRGAEGRYVPGSSHLRGAEDRCVPGSSHLRGAKGRCAPERSHLRGAEGRCVPERSHLRGAEDQDAVRHRVIHRLHSGRPACVADSRRSSARSGPGADPAFRRGGGRADQDEVVANVMRGADSERETCPHTSTAAMSWALRRRPIWPQIPCAFGPACRLACGLCVAQDHCARIARSPRPRCG